MTLGTWTKHRVVHLLDAATRTGTPLGRAVQKLGTTHEPFTVGGRWASATTAADGEVQRRADGGGTPRRGEAGAGVEGRSPAASGEALVGWAGQGGSWAGWWLRG